MSRLQELINRLCPDGVPFKQLGDYITICTGEQFNKRDMNEEGSYPVINGGINPSGYIENFNENKDTITISQGGASAGYVAWQEYPFWAGAHCYVVKPSSSILMKRFIYFFLKNNESYLQQMQHGAGIPALNRDKVKNLLIPVPPIEVQEEIVRILDNFSSYAAELQAELQARREQYEYYRNLLLTFSPSACGFGTDDKQEIDDVTMPPPNSYKIQWKTMGEVCKIQRGIRVVKENLSEHGSFPVFQNSLKPLGYFEKFNMEGDKTFIIGAGAAGEIGYNKNRFWAADDCFTMIPRENILSRFMYHWLLLNQHRLKSNVRKASVPRLSREYIAKIKIPVPPLELQEKIVATLDKFETLVNDLTAGLPAEIEAVRQQYEYYRNKLLTFKQRA